MSHIIIGAWLQIKLLSIIISLKKTFVRGHVYCTVPVVLCTVRVKCRAMGRLRPAAPPTHGSGTSLSVGAVVAAASLPPLNLSIQSYSHTVIREYKIPLQSRATAANRM